MEKIKALEKLDFKLDHGKYKKLICDKKGDKYYLSCDIGKAGFQVDVKYADGRDSTDGVGKYKGTQIYSEMEKIADELEALMNEVDIPTEAFPEDFSQIKETTYEEVGVQKKVNMKKPGRMIKGLTPRLAEKGKIKIGKKGKMITSKNGNQFRPPEKLDHFEVTTMDKNKDGDYILDETIMNIIRDDCRAIPVRLPYDDPTLNFLTCYALYEGTSCKCRGDGENAERNNEIIPCNPETCPHYTNKECKPNGILSLILDCAPTVGGVWKLRTVGWNSINNLISSMEFIRHLTNGILAGLPLMLTLTPKHTTVPGTKTPTLIHMVNLEYRGSLMDMAQAIQQTMSTRALMQYSVKDYEKLAEAALELPEAPDECKDIVEEFYPESVKA